MKTIYLMLFCVVSFLGCSNHSMNVEVIRVDVNDKQLCGCEFKCVDTIELETNSSSLIGGIQKLEYYKNRIYILDVWYSKSLLVFDKDGYFISKTSSGHGPGEMVNPFAFSIDRDKDCIMVWDQTLSAMFKYDLDLNFKSTKVNNVLVRDFAKIGKDSFLVLSYKPIDGDGKNLNTYAVFSEDFDREIDRFLPIKHDRESLFMSNPISISERILFTVPLDYSIYAFNDGVAESYRVDFGGNQLSDVELELPFEKVMELKDQEKILGVSRLIESRNYIGFQYYIGRRGAYCLYHRHLKKAIHVNSFMVSGIVPELNILGLVDYENDLLIGEIMEPSFNEKSGDANPCLLIFKIME